MGICNIEYIAFVAICVVLYYVIHNSVMQKIVLLIASLYFYLTYGYIAIVYVCCSTVLAYTIGLLIKSFERYKKVFLLAFVIADVSELVFIKYIFGNGLLDGILANTSSIEKLLVIPLGIAYYTLSLLGYVIDVYSNKYDAEKDILKFVLFVVFFPHILQGPIARYDKLSVQFDEVKRFDYDLICYNAQLMLWGYVKKLIIANMASMYVDSVYSKWEIMGGTELLVASILYTIQIYADFSGCVDIMRGTAGLFGIELMENFRQPYFSKSIGEFWRRWHISLSTWFRDYLYIPLGGNRKGKARRFFNVFIVFLTSGIWHGTTINFLIWGSLHGLYQIIEDLLYGKIIKKKPKDIDNRYGWMQWLITIALVNFAWIFFRISDIGNACGIINRIFTRLSIENFFNDAIINYGLDLSEWRLFLFFVVVLLIVEICNIKQINIRKVIARQPILIRWSVWIIGLVCVAVFGVYGTAYSANDFIYMKF